MKILHLFSSKVFAGLERHLEELSHEQSKNHEVVVVGPESLKENFRCKYKVLDTNQWRHSPILYSQTKAIINSIAPNVLHTHASKMTSIVNKFKDLNLQEGETLLDMGCGEGRHSIGGLIETSANIIGLDLCLKDVQTAKERLNDFDISGLNTVCNFGVANIVNIPFQESSLDAVICREVHEHVDSPKQSVQELIRVLKPGGIMALSVPRYLPELICWKLLI